MVVLVLMGPFLARNVCYFVHRKRRRKKEEKEITRLSGFSSVLFSIMIQDISENIAPGVKYSKNYDCYY